ncbi:MAG: hypothetical protein DHS20C18_17660 [Saprospiraceae bacterium]|nr:MAG: hypothetical protein DHS20C18_17660 [Saprospiraceae bacterium]
MDIEIKIEDVQLIMGDLFSPGFQACLDSTYCGQCEDNCTSVKIEKLWLNHLGDVIVEGSCKKCNGKTNRYIETGEHAESYDQAMAIRELQIDLLKCYNTRF